jgi:hypothetical protein
MASTSPKAFTSAFRDRRRHEARGRQAADLEPETDGRQRGADVRWRRRSKPPRGGHPGRAAHRVPSISAFVFALVVCLTGARRVGGTGTDRRRPDRPHALLRRRGPRCLRALRVARPLGVVLLWSPRHGSDRSVDRADSSPIPDRDARGAEDVARWLDGLVSGAVVGAVVELLSSRNRGLVKRLEDEARVDELTGLLNRRGFVERAEIELCTRQSRAVEIRSWRTDRCPGECGRSQPATSPGVNGLHSERAQIRLARRRRIAC